MAAISAIALVGGLLLSAAGTGVQFIASQKAAEAQEKGIEAQKRAEFARAGQASLEAQRRKREIIRQGIIARSAATSQATQQGAQFGSTLPGALAGLTGQTAYNVSGVQQSEGLGQQIFGANLAGLDASRQQAQAQQMAGIGSGLGSLGGALTKQLGPIGRLTYGIA